MKNSKRMEFITFPLKIASHFSFLLIFFLLNNIKKKLYDGVPEILNFNPKTSSRKYPIITVGITFSVLMFQIFTRILLMKTKTLSPNISTRN